MKEVLIVLGVVIIVLFFINGIFSRRMEEKDKELEAHEHVKAKDAEADASKSGSNLDTRVRNKYGNR